MTKQAKELKEMKATLKRLNNFIAKNTPATTGVKMTENTVNTKLFGNRYVFIEIDKADLELRKRLKAIRYGAQKRGKARWIKEASAWSILYSAIEGTEFAS